MAIAHTVENYMAERGIRYDVISHPHSHSSAETAELAHVPGDRSTTIVFPVPIDLVTAIGGAKPSA